MKMTVEQARELRDALNQAILNASNAGAAEVDLQGVLSAKAGEALDALAEAIEASKRS